MPFFISWLNIKDHVCWVNIIICEMQHHGIILRANLIFLAFVLLNPLLLLSKVAEPCPKGKIYGNKWQRCISFIFLYRNDMNPYIIKKQISTKCWDTEDLGFDYEVTLTLDDYISRPDLVLVLHFWRLETRWYFRLSEYKQPIFILEWCLKLMLYFLQLIMSDVIFHS